MSQFVRRPGACDVEKVEEASNHSSWSGLRGITCRDGSIHFGVDSPRMLAVWILHIFTHSVGDLWLRSRRDLCTGIQSRCNLLYIVRERSEALAAKRLEVYRLPFVLGKLSRTGTGWPAF